MRRGTRTLYVYAPDDSTAPDDGELARGAEEMTVVTAHGVADALNRLATDTFDCVLSTYRLPNSDGVTLLSRIRESDADLPVILYTARGSERIASEAIAADVTDYIRGDTAATQTDLIIDRIQDVLDYRPTDTAARLNELTEATKPALWIVAADWTEMFSMAGAHTAVWGHSEETVRADPRSVLDAVHPEDQPRVKEMVDQLLTDEAVETELRVDPPDGPQRDVFLRAVPISQSNGSVEKIAVVSCARTDKHTYQRQLHKEEQLTESIFTALPDVLYTFDTEGYLLRWNDQLEAETGYSGREIADMYVTDFVPAGEVATIASSFQAVIEDGETVTVESAFKTKDGARVPFEFTGAPLRDADGELYGVTGVGRNIADQKRRQRRFEAVFNNTYQFTGLMSPDGTLLEVNSAAVEFAGRSRDELVGQKIWDAYWFQTNKEAAQTAKHAVNMAQEGEFFREQITVQGGVREAVIDFSVRPVIGEDGTVELLVPEGRDITRLSQREQQLKVTNRFLRHNIRNKLTTIQGYARVMSEYDDPDLKLHGETITQAATELNKNAELARQINALITDEPTPEPVDLREQLERAGTIVENRHAQAEVIIDAPESLNTIGLKSLHEAFAELLVTIFDGAPAESLILDVSVSNDNTAVIKIPSVGDSLSQAAQDVLSGDIELKQTQHAEGLGVWYMYWTIWYSGGEVIITEDSERLRVQLPIA